MLVIKGGRVLDPSQGLDQPATVIVEGSTIKDIAKRAGGSKNAKTIDAKGCWVVPGLIDMHVHLREPGQEGKETIVSGTRAAAAGGFTSIVCMPNTAPVIDTQAGIQFVLSRVAKGGIVNVYPTGAVTRGQLGEELCEIGDLVQAGAIAISDDGRPVMDAEVMRRALEYAKMFDIPVLDHCEDLRLAEKGSLNEGRMSTILGLRGIPNEAESTIAARDIQLARLSGGKLHICHVSARETVEVVRQGKKQGVRVSAEVTPHHLALTEEVCRDFDTNTKMNPPLRTLEDQASLWKGLRDGTIDCIATDHAPHTQIEKDFPFDQAPFGVIGLETCVQVLMTECRRRKEIAFEQLLPCLTVNPARILNIPKGTLEPGRDADIAILDPERKGTVTGRDFLSRSSNSPFVGLEYIGSPVATIVGGKLVHGK